MELTTWRNAPAGKILKSDVSVAKNYLDEPEINELNRIVTMYLDYADNQVARQIPMKMTDWAENWTHFYASTSMKCLTTLVKYLQK